MGPSNHLAYVACRAVVDSPGTKYNPLLIYGGAGLGKTYLLQATARALQDRAVADANSSLRVHCTAAEIFMNEYIAAAQDHTIGAFRAQYREGCDVLLMDDIQFIAGKDRTMEEFFHAFNSLHEHGKQCVFTADRPPHEIAGLDDRIRSRLQWGLLADIQPPELKTRIALVEHNARAHRIDLPGDVATFIATQVRGNVRALNGFLLRIAAVASLRKQAITVAFAQETLKDLLDQISASLTVEVILREVATHFGLKVADIKGNKRHQPVARPRQIAMYLSRKLVKSSYPELGQRFGGKDHTTVIAACRRVESLLVTDSEVRRAVQTLTRALCGDSPVDMLAG